MFGIPNPFGSKDKPEEKKPEPSKIPHAAAVKQSDSRGSLPYNAGAGTGTQVAAQSGPSQAQVIEQPSIAFDARNIEAIKGSFDRLAKAFDELKKLNEQHRGLQAENLSLFSGMKDKKIADLEKLLAVSEALVAKRAEEVSIKQKMLDDSTIELNELHKKVHTLSVELTTGQNQLSEARASLSAEQSNHGALRSAHSSLQDLEKELNAKQVDLTAMIADLNTQIQEKQKANDELREEMEVLRGSLSRRLAQFVPAGILESVIGPQVVGFDDEAAAGDALALRVIAGLSQLRAAFVPGAGAEDKLVAVKTIGSALYAAWSSKAMDPVSIHQSFVQWQDFLNAIPDAEYKLVLPDLGQNPSANVIAPAGVTKVSEVQLWIIKGDSGAIYARGVIR
jgi:hypothetical protein